MSTLITDPDQVTADWLTHVLYSCGCLERGTVAAVEQMPALNAASWIVPLRLTYSEDAPHAAPARLILKLSRPEWNRDGREAEFYTTIASRMINPPTIQCYDAAYSPELGKSHFLLEDLSDTHVAHPPAQLPPLQIHCEQIVDALANFHAQWWDHAQLRDIGLPTEATIKREIAEAQDVYGKFANFLSDRLSEKRRAIYERVFAGLTPLLVKRLCAESGLTLIHGDPHIGNFLYPRDSANHTLRILDWKSWHVRIGPADLAHMMAVFWFPERRARMERELLTRYHDRLLEGGVKDYDWEACWYDYRLSVISYLLYPVWQWARQTPPDIWWHHLERLMCAFEDLACADLLGSH